MKTLYERAMDIKKGVATAGFSKAGINVDNLADGGLLTPRQRDQFIDWIFTATELLEASRTVTMPTPKFEMPGLVFPSRLVRGVGINTEIYGGTSQGDRDTEDQSGFLRGNISSFNIVLDAKEVSLAYAFQENLLMDNIEGQNLANKLANWFATQFGIDHEEMCILGQVVDTNPASPISVLTSGVTDASATTMVVTGDPLLAGFPEVSVTGYLYFDHGGPGVELMLYNGRRCSCS